MHSLLLATRNAHKTREFAALLGSEFRVADLTEAGDLAPVEENGKTFEENAALKAIAISLIRPGLVVADDSGLEVDSLGGAPGVYSARYAGQDASDEENVAKLLGALRNRPDRFAQFRCAVVLAQSGKVVANFQGAVRGRIAEAARGTVGFGYDPVFVPEAFDQTFATLGEAVKNRISHRARAVQQLRDYLLANEKGGATRRP